jgi:predicted outer membrane repeat protein
MDGFKKDEDEAYVLLANGTGNYTDFTPLAGWPATVYIDGGKDEGEDEDGGNGTLTGNGSGITVGAAKTLGLLNFTFSNIPFTVASGGKLALEYGAVIRDYRGNATAGVTVNGGTLEMYDGSAITNNKNGSVEAVNYGGGVYMYQNSTFTMYGGEISGNTAADGGGGVYMQQNSTFTMNGGEISDNSAGSGGGVLLWYGDTFNMNGGEISWNTATDGGGVALLNGGTANMSGGIIKNNTAANGGGVWIGSNVPTTPFNMTGGEITGNEATGDNGIGGVYGTINEGDPLIGEGTKPDNRGWIHGNTKTDGTPSNLSDGDE